MLIEPAGQIRPSRAQRNDVAFGWPLLVELVALNAASALTVREGDVIAVDGAEDLATTIERTGRLCRRRGWSLLLADGAAAALDGPMLERLRRARAGCVAVEEGQASPALIEAAREQRIALVQVDSRSDAVTK